MASRSKVYWFRHNDMMDLERILKEQEVRDAKVPSDFYTLPLTFVLLDGFIFCNHHRDFSFLYV